MNRLLTTPEQHEPILKHEQANALYRLADFLDDNHDLMPYSGVTITRSADTLQEAREIMAASPGHWSKQNLSYAFVYTKTFTPELEDFKYREVQFSVYVYKSEESTGCRRVDTGRVRHIDAVEAVEEHDEPIYEWVCDDDDDDSSEVESS